MSVVHHRDFLIIFHHDLQTKKGHICQHHSHSPSQSPEEEESHQTPGSCPGSFTEKKGSYSNLLADLIHTDIQIPNICQDTTCLFTSSKNTYTTASRSRSQFLKPLEGVIDVKHITIKSLKKSGTDYYNYKAFSPGAGTQDTASFGSM